MTGMDNATLNGVKCTCIVELPELEHIHPSSKVYQFLTQSSDQSSGCQHVSQTGAILYHSTNADAITYTNRAMAHDLQEQQSYHDQSAA